MQRRYCPFCGSPTDEMYANCGACGAPLGQQAEPPSGATDKAEAPASAQPSPAVPQNSPPVAGGAWPPAPIWPAQSGVSGGSPVPLPPGQPGWYPAPYPYAPGGYYAPYPYGGYYGGYPQPYIPVPYRPVKPRRAPGETYALVISWIVSGAGALSVLAGLAVTLLVMVALLEERGSALDLLAFGAVAAVGPVVAGGFAIYYGIRGILRSPSKRFTLPNPWLFALLTVLTLGAGVVIWNLSLTPPPAIVVIPLLLLTGILPALTILAVGAWRLRLPSTRRHVWMSLIYGATLAPLVAVILEVGAAIGIALAVRALGQNGSYALSDLTSTNPTNPLQVIILLLTISVAAPIVEEGVKPLGAVLIMRRIKTPASAFLIGLAAGVGFDIFETIGYIGSGGADWIMVAIERVGAGLLHGVGAGMAALGWYYLINGRGVRYRWLRGFGGIFYAVIQHAIFNGSNLLLAIPGSFGNWMSQPYYLGGLPLDRGSLFFFGLYIVLIGVLFAVAERLVRPPASLAGPPDHSASSPESDLLLAQQTEAGSAI